MAESASTGPDNAKSTRHLLAEGDSAGMQKKRRIPGACDLCKRKKIRCDSAKMPDNRCTNCLQAGIECTHDIVLKSFGGAKGYVENLEARVMKMEKLLHKLLPGIKVNEELERIHLSADENLPPNDDDGIEIKKPNRNPDQMRFYGKSSHYQFAQTVLDMKLQFIGLSHENIGVSNIKWKRPEIWDYPRWLGSDALQDHWQEKPNYNYPPDDLTPILIDAYFANSNVFLPLLHRPIFERSVADGLHLSDAQFGATLLLVCAIGANYCRDPRVLVDATDTWLSAGWKWVKQVKLHRNPPYKKATLYEVQAFALHALYTQASPLPDGVWTQVGQALRLCQEVGAHRKRKQNCITKVEDELWKRVFWVLLILDRRSSAMQGRTCVLQNEDFDSDLPIECDDEYWDQGFQQPVGLPSSIAFFNSYLRLMDIFGHAIRLIYSVKRPGFPFETKSDQDLITELDSMTNNWMDSVPPHLRWSSDEGNQPFSRQSAWLYASYYHLQIFIHRPFITSCRQNSNTFPSLEICTDAARSCCQVLAFFAKGKPFTMSFEVFFTAAIILLLNIWCGKQFGLVQNLRKDLEDVQQCMELLKESNERWILAGKYLDFLVAVSTVGDLSSLSLDDVVLETTTASPRKGQVMLDNSGHPAAESTPLNDQQPQTLGPWSTSIQNQARCHSDIGGRSEGPSFKLPMYSTDIGRQPGCEPFHSLPQFSTTAPTTNGSLDNMGSVFDSLIPSTLNSAQESSMHPSLTGIDVLEGGDTMLSHPSLFQSIESHQQNIQSSTLNASWNPSHVYSQEAHSNSAFNATPMDMDLWSLVPTDTDIDAWCAAYLDQMAQSRDTLP